MAVGLEWVKKVRKQNFAYPKENELQHRRHSGGRFQSTLLNTSRDP